MHRVFALSLLLLGTACAPMQWVRPGADAAQVDADTQQCRQQAWQETRSTYFPYMSFPMYSRRFSGPFGDPWGDRFMEESRLAQFCMRVKGYELQAAPKK